MKTAFRLFGFVLTWIMILIQYLLHLKMGHFDNIAASTFNYLGYFTILTNILVSFAFIAPLLPASSAIHRFFNHQGVRAAIALYIFVVMVVYWALLAAIHEVSGLASLANYGLHLFIPIIYILDWLIYAPKKSMTFKALPLWVIYPLAYGLFTLLRGMISGFYAYPFLDVGALGITQVTLNMLGFTVFYLIGGMIFIGIGRILPAPRKDTL